MQQQAAAAQAEAEAAEAARRQLAAQLAAEEEALKQELLRREETPAQRRAHMAARAHELGARREAERQVPPVTRAHVHVHSSMSVGPALLSCVVCLMAHRKPCAVAVVLTAIVVGVRPANCTAARRHWPRS